MPSLTRAALPLCHLRLQSRHSGRGLDCLRGSGEVAPSAPPTLHLVVNSPAPPFSSAQITPTGSAIRCLTLIPWAICRAGEESQISTTVTDRQDPGSPYCSGLPAEGLQQERSRQSAGLRTCARVGVPGLPRRRVFGHTPEPIECRMASGQTWPRCAAGDLVVERVRRYPSWLKGPRKAQPT